MPPETSGPDRPGDSCKICSRALPEGQTDCPHCVTSVNVAPSSPPRPEISGYKILRIIGKGGMGLVYEALHDAELISPGEPPSGSIGGAKPELVPGRSMVLDHRRIVATALGRLRGKIRYRPVVLLRPVALR